MYIFAPVSNFILGLVEGQRPRAVRRGACPAGNRACKLLGLSAALSVQCLGVDLELVLQVCVGAADG